MDDHRDIEIRRRSEMIHTSDIKRKNDPGAITTGKSRQGGDGMHTRISVSRERRGK